MNLLKCMSKNSKMIHISSDYVFDGKDGNYKENDMKKPINYYGKQSLKLIIYLWAQFKLFNNKTKCSILVKHRKIIIFYLG